MGSHSHWFTSPLFHEHRTSPMSGPSSGLQKNQDACRMKGEEDMSNSYKRWTLWGRSAEQVRDPRGEATGKGPGEACKDKHSSLRFFNSKRWQPSQSVSKMKNLISNIFQSPWWEYSQRIKQISSHQCGITELRVGNSHLVGSTLLRPPANARDTDTFKTLENRKIIRRWRI